MSLIAAADGNEIEKVKQLIAEGVDVNQANEEGWTPLIYAANNVRVD